MKLIIIESPDCLGKNLLIKGLCEYYNYDNVMIRHFGKPPKNLNFKDIEKFQWNAFSDEANFILQSKSNFSTHLESYYENIFIWNRGIHGEYVYSAMFRYGDKEFLANQIRIFEKYKFHDTNLDVTFILLTATPEFALSKEDGKSFSQTLEQKTEELNLFNEIFESSSIKKKIKIQVNEGNNFINKEKILKTAIEFIEK
jgi:thymidylate kinase